MGEYYYFDFQEVDGEIKAGFCYKNESTGWNEIFVEFTQEQLNYANDWQQRSNELDDERVEVIKSWIK